MKIVMEQMKIIFWGIMLLIGFMLTGSFIAVAMNAENIVNIVKEEKNITEDSAEFR